MNPVLTIIGPQPERFPEGIHDHPEEGPPQKAETPPGCHCEDLESVNNRAHAVTELLAGILKHHAMPRFPAEKNN